MGKVIGFIDAASWRTMRELRAAIKDYSDEPKYKVAKEKYTEVYGEYLQRFARAA